MDGGGLPSVIHWGCELIISWAKENSDENRVPRFVCRRGCGQRCRRRGDAAPVAGRRQWAVPGDGAGRAVLLARRYRLAHIRQVGAGDDRGSAGSQPVLFHAGDTLAGDEHLQATRDIEGSYAIVYSPSGRAVHVCMEKLAGPAVKARWFNPRTGEMTAIGEFANTGERQFTPPSAGEDNDWVLVLDSKE